jgi:hypothetical protein
MSQEVIAAIAIAGFLGFMAGYFVAWRQEHGRRPRHSLPLELVDPDAYRAAFRAELERIGADNIEDRVRRLQ